MLRTFCTAVVILCALLAMPMASAQPATQPAPTLPALSGATVAVPWSELSALLEKSGGRRPPVDVVYAPATYTAKLADNAVEVVADVQVTLLREDAALVPVAPADAVVESVTVDGQPAALVLQGKTLSALLTGGGKKALRVTSKRGVSVQDDVTRFDVPLAEWPISIVQITAPGSQRITASGAIGAKAAEQGGATTLSATYRGGAVASITVTPAALKPAKVNVLTQTRVSVDRGVLRCQANVTYEILHAGVESFRIALPVGAELIEVAGDGIRDSKTVEENGVRFLVVTTKDIVRKQYALSIAYDVAFAEKAIAAAEARGNVAANPATMPATRPGAAGPGVAANEAPAVTGTAAVPLISHPDAATSRGYIGVEVRGGYEVKTSVANAERIDVKELPRQLWSMSRAPILEAYRYDGSAATMSLTATRHQDLDVLVAMADVCEASTTITPDGRCVTKLMYVVRNNLKPSMTLQLPAGAQVWSTFVDDRPVTPSRLSDGKVLIPLKRSEEVEEHDDESYKAKRDRRRQGEEARVIKEMQKARDSDELAADLKPYDVEVVYVTPSVKLADRGQIELALPQSDVPVGHLAWAVFLPKQYRVVDSAGNVNEVARFTLPFRHFGDVALARAKEVADMQKAAQQMQQLAQQAEAFKSIAEASKVAGVLPVRVEIPIAGEITRFEKLLVVDEMAKTTVSYSRRVD